jgi:hypothetical protein
VARRGVTSVGRAIAAVEVPAALGVLHAIAEGADWATAGLPGGNPVAVCHDIRTYYEEAALALADGPAPGGRAVEDWFFSDTAAGATMLAARVAMRDAGAKFPIWFTTWCPATADLCVQQRPPAAQAGRGAAPRQRHTAVC